MGMSPDGEDRPFAAIEFGLIAPLSQPGGDRVRHLTFAGGFDDDGVMRLYGPEAVQPDGRAAITRMGWVDVEEASFDWHWERSFDGGENWEMVWLIHYERR